MKNVVLVLLSTASLTLGSVSAGAQDELVYVAVEPCRIADTRKSSRGVIRADTSRNFLVSGTASELAAQGGQVACLGPKAEQRPVAISAYILAVPAPSSSGQGVLSAYPADQPVPPKGSGSTVNFAAGQTIGNTTIATVCADEKSCPFDGELAILSRLTDEHVVVDVQGYFYPQTSLPGYEIVRSGFATAGSNAVNGEAICSPGKKVLGGGGSLVASAWSMDSSNPRPDGLGWQVRYKTSGETFSASGHAWAVCARAD